MKKISAEGSALCCLCLLFWPIETRATPNPAKRVVTVCAMDDAVFPVSHATIKSLIVNLSDDYAREVKISFRLVEIKDDWLPMPRLDGPNPSEAARALCGSGDIVLLFSDTPSFFREKGIIWEHLGTSTRADGVAWIFKVEHRLKGEHSAFLTLEHEVAHLFGAKDTEKHGSFMNPSERGWTRKLRRVIAKNRDRMHWSDSVQAADIRKDR